MLPGMQNGKITRGIKPSWEPLIGLVGKDLVPGFMWMFAIELDDGAEVHGVQEHRDAPVRSPRHGWAGVRVPHG